MSKACAKCERAVYPLEELKCLDKVWHKACFKCQECGMTLSMRNYKGFNRLPYCTAHCPQAKHTTVADTPEIRRIQENTKIQSTVKYHEEFEKQKGKVTQIADDPETLRIKQNTRIISNVAYHGELERKAAMEQKRPMAEGFEDGSTDQPYSDEEVKAPPTPNPIPEIQPVVATNQGYIGPPRNQTVRMVEEQQSQHAKDSPYSSRQASTVIYTSEHGAAAANNIYWGHGSTVVYCSDFGPVTNPASRKVGSIADYDPVNDNFGSLGMPSQANYRMGGKDPRAMQQQQQQHAMQQQQQQHAMLQQQQQQQQHVMQQMQQQQQQQPPPQQPPPSSGLKYRAMYDYTAADSDEVSFLDGDIIVNCTPVDEGWMTGMVQRTGRRGMLPANYVELAN